MKKEYAFGIQGVLAAAGAYLSAKLGILYPILCILVGIMIADYLSGMGASKVESIDHPGDPNYGWSSKKGAKGIFKKFGYLCVIAAGLALDYVLVKASGTLAFQMPIKGLFGLLLAIWYLLNEFLSIIENAGRMGAPVPDWLKRYIAVLKDKIDKQVE